MRKKKPRIRQKKETASDRSRLNLDRTVLVITNGKVTGATVNIGGELVKQLSVHKDRNVTVVAAAR